MLLNNNIPLSYVFGKVRRELIIILIYTLGIAIMHEVFEVNSLTIPISVPGILGTVISLLLGFRSQQAYDRWWEARQIWGAIVNDSRTMTRQLLTFTDVIDDFEIAQHFQRRLVHRHIAWCYSLSQTLRNKSPLAGLENYMSKKDLDFVSNYTNVPMGILELHGRDFKKALDEGWINRYQHIELDRTLTRFCDSMGACERIKKTVFPSTYRVYIHFSLLLFISLLPFSVIEYLGFFEIPLVMAVSACFLLIEKMGIHLQDPFENKPTDTPMTAISKTIERDLRQMLNDHQLLIVADAVSEDKEKEELYYQL